MFERLQKPFLTVETGEAYQPIRLTYNVSQPEKLAAALNNIKCLTLQTTNSWHWYWRDECNDLHFESLDSFKRDTVNDIRLGTFSIRDNHLYCILPSFKRACLAVPLFHRLIDTTIANVHVADFINKVFGLTERLPHGFSELFSDSELNSIVNKRVEDYEKVQESCETATSVEEAFSILAQYSKIESMKRLPYAERYLFEEEENTDPDIAFLGFYIFLRSRELVAIRRWFGETGYTLADAADETVAQVFGNMDIDIIE